MIAEDREREGIEMQSVGIEGRGCQPGPHKQFRKS